MLFCIIVFLFWIGKIFSFSFIIRHISFIVMSVVSFIIRRICRNIWVFSFRDALTPVPFVSNQCWNCTIFRKFLVLKKSRKFCCCPFRRLTILASSSFIIVWATLLIKSCRRFLSVVSFSLPVSSSTCFLLRICTTRAGLFRECIPFDTGTSAVTFLTSYKFFPMSMPSSSLFWRALMPPFCIWWIIILSIQVPANLFSVFII